MAEVKRAQLQSIDIEKVDIKKSKKPDKKKQIALSVRFNLELFESNEKKCPEFDYSQLLKDAEKRHRKDKKKDSNPINGSDPLNENDEEKVLDIARYYESKYGNRKKSDYVDLGAGYDINDSFIDNTDAYDELVPEEMTTVFGGFYINSGALEFQNTDNTEQLKRNLKNGKSEEESSSSSDSSESDDEEDSEDDDDDEDDDDEEEEEDNNENESSNDKNNEKKSKSQKKVKAIISSSSENEESEDKDKNNSVKLKSAVDNIKGEENLVKLDTAGEQNVQPPKPKSSDNNERKMHPPKTKPFDPSERKMHPPKVKPPNVTERKMHPPKMKPQNNSNNDGKPKAKRLDIADFQNNPPKKKRVDNVQGQTNLPKKETKKVDNAHNQVNPPKTKKIDNATGQVKPIKTKPAGNAQYQVNPLKTNQINMSAEHNTNQSKMKMVDNPMYQSSLAKQLENTMFQLNPTMAKQIENVSKQMYSKGMGMTYPFDSSITSQIDITPCSINTSQVNTLNNPMFQYKSKQFDISGLQGNPSIPSQLNITACPPTSSSKTKRNNFADIYPVNSHKPKEVDIIGCYQAPKTNPINMSTHQINPLKTKQMDISASYPVNSSKTSQIDISECYQVNPSHSKQFEIGECQIIPTKSKRIETAELPSAKPLEPKSRTDMNTSYEIVD